MKIGSLFSGIGGFELGLQTGIPNASVAWQVEIDPYCRNVLARHWPDSKRFDDVREVGARNLAPVDIVCGGFPCQDISVAGKGEGLDGERSGLWFQMLRIIEELRPRYVIAENVSALRTRGLDVVLAGLRNAGYVASWSIVGAADLGAPHRRDRMWIVAYRRDVEPAYAPRVTHDDRVACMRDVWPRDGGDPEAWERGEPRTMLARTGVNRRARLHALGNAVVPQIPAMIGRQLVGGFSLSAPAVGGVAPYLPTATVAERDNAGGAKPGPVRPCLSTMARLRIFPTPTCNDSYNDAPPSQFLRKTIPLNCVAAGTPGGGCLSPRWVELLMGYPLDWTVAE